MSTRHEHKSVFTADNKDFKRKTKEVESRGQKMAKTLKKIGAAIGAVFVVKKIVQFTNEISKLGGELGDLSKQTGLSTDALQKYQYAAEKAGVPQNLLTGSLVRFQKRLGEAAHGSGILASRLSQMNPELLANMQNAENTNEAFRMYMDALNGISDEAERAAIAQAAFGAEGRRLVLMARGGTEAIDAMGKELEETGGILSKDLVEASEEYGDRMESMKMAIRGVKIMLADALMPIFEKVLTATQDFAKYVQENKERITKWAKGIGIAAGALGVAKVAMVALNVAMAANPIGIVITAVAGLTAAVVTLWKTSDKFRARVKYIWESVKYYFTFAKDYVTYVAEVWLDTFKTYFKAIAELAKVLWESIKAAFQRGKSPADIFREGLEGIKKDIENIGKDAGDKFKKSFYENSKPDYEKILADEGDAEKAGEKAGEEFAKGFNKGSGGVERNAPDVISGIADIDMKAGPLDIDTNSLRTMKDQAVSLEELKQKYAELTSGVDVYTQAVINNMLMSSTSIEEFMAKAESFGGFWDQASAAAVEFGQAMLASGQMGIDSMQDLARYAVSTAKKIIAAKIAEGVASAITETLKNTPVPFPFNVIIAGAAGAAAATLFNALIPNFAEGGAVSGPTLALVGEAAGISRTNPEYIGTAKQLSQMGQGSRGGMLTARVSRGDLLFILNEGESYNKRSF
jgi:hypothetical protein